jgi:hypothetical protein
MPLKEEFFNLPVGRRAMLVLSVTCEQELAAKTARVTVARIREALLVRRRGGAALTAAVERGAISLGRAHLICLRPGPEQAAALEAAIAKPLPLDYDGRIPQADRARLATMNAAQRAMVAAHWKVPGKMAAAAAEVHVTRIADAARVLRHGCPGLAAAVEAGEIALDRARIMVAALNPAQQLEELARVLALPRRSDGKRYNPKTVVPRMIRRSEVTVALRTIESLATHAETLHHLGRGDLRQLAASGHVIEWTEQLTKVVTRVRQFQRKLAEGLTS